jgi:NADPH:quinone reductase-like Zn-dependent oxidoreductase
MRAFGFEEHGGPEVLEHFERDEPDVGPGEVKVKVEAVALNHLDLWVREGWPGLDLGLPHTLGTDTAGVIEEVGRDVEGLDRGDSVVVNPALWCGVCRACEAGEQSLCESFSILGEHVSGTLTESVVVPARNVLLRPGTLETAEAASVPLVFQTAWRMANKAEIRPGDLVVVPGAGGGVATAAIQIAKYLGGHVIATTSAEEKAKRAEDLGADEVVDYTEDDWGKQVHELTNGAGVDVVLDTAGQDVWPEAQQFMTPGGRLVCCGATSGPQATLDLRYVFYRQLEFLGSTMANAREFDEAMSLVFNGWLDPVVDRTFGFEEAHEAFEYLEEGNQFGKVVVEVA